MQYLFEYSDTLNSPYEAFFYDSGRQGFPIRPHWHYFMELVYILEGKTLIECNGKSFVLNPGEMILFHPEAVHAFYSASEEAPKYGVIKFDVNKLYTENNYAPKLKTILNKASKDKNALIHFTREKLEGIPAKETFEICCSEIADKKYGYDIVVHDRICTLLVSLIRLWREQGFDTSAIRAEDIPTDSLSEITAYIDSHAGEPLKVEELAERCNMSYSYFAKSFKQYYGRSCKEYIEFIRICKAEDLLLFTDYDLNYISQETGFSDSSHLIKTFKKWKGDTPKRHKNNRVKAEY